MSWAAHAEEAHEGEQEKDKYKLQGLASQQG